MSDSPHSTDHAEHTEHIQASSGQDSVTQKPLPTGDSGNQSITLYVSGLARSMREDDLRTLFEPYGELTRVKVVNDPHTGDNRGFGFVGYLNDSCAQAAIDALDKKDHLGRSLAIERARRDRPRSPTPGQYHGPTRDRGHERRPRRDDRRRRYSSRSRSRSRSRSYSRDGRRSCHYGRDRADRYEPSRDSYGYGDRDYRPYPSRPAAPPTFYPPPREGMYQAPPGARYDAYTVPPMYMAPTDYERRYPAPMPPRPRSPSYN